ncbi:MAG: response regulator [Pirellulales bacterium]|nr:response regulator [Pirellulales bacterium]
MIQAINTEYRVVVVDPRHSDYAHLVDGALRADLCLNLLSTGRSALRAAREIDPDLWIINTCLPDMAGTDLFQMLHSQLDHVPVVLLADEYSRETELCVRRVGAPIFACKPLDPGWLVYGAEHRQRQMSFVDLASTRSMRRAV